MCFTSGVLPVPPMVIFPTTTIGTPEFQTLDGFFAYEFFLHLTAAEKINVNGDKRYQFTFKLTKNKIADLSKKLIYGNSLVRPLVGFPENIYNKYYQKLCKISYCI